MEIFLTFNDYDSQYFNIEINNHILLKSCQNWHDYKNEFIIALDDDFYLDDDERKILSDPYVEISGFSGDRRYEIGLGEKTKALIKKIVKEVN